jgi:hypothetical protein
MIILIKEYAFFKYHIFIFYILVYSTYFFPSRLLGRLRSAFGADLLSTNAFLCFKMFDMCEYLSVILNIFSLH